MINAYALGVSLTIGMAERKKEKGCQQEYNPQAGLFTQSAREMMNLLKITGGEEDKMIYGIGNLYVTVFGGRTRKTGTLLGRA